MANKNIHYLNDDWETGGKIHSVYVFKEESLSKNPTDDCSWIGLSCMVYEGNYLDMNKGSGEPELGSGFNIKRNRWWQEKEPMHPEAVACLDADQLKQVIENMQAANRFIRTNGEINIVNIVWNVEPTEKAQ